MQNSKVKFGFKSRKDKDEKTGEVIKVAETVIDKDTKEEKATGKMIDKVIPAAKPVEIEIPLLTLEDIVDVLNGKGTADGKPDDKEVKLILEACNNMILEQARAKVNEDPEAAREKGINTEEISWHAIAYLPPATRKGTAISDETWEAFEVDYVSVMVHHGKTEDKAKMGAKLLAKKFQPVKLNKNVI